MPGGIIPARAGFTAQVVPLGGRHPDHPRSRGVYGRTPTRMRKVWGSSPLARGLPTPTQRTPATSGIIPARAGFTGSENHSQVNDRDHPRSRGVYPGATHIRIRTMGSSPLARGLRQVEPAAGAGHGIIPARAGFTFPCTANSQPGKDHPRSRGVYRTHYRNQAHLLGSSPLARGLRRGCRGLRGRDRIIPARAGFTLKLACLTIGLRDHPRSRGVYLTTQYTLMVV